MASKSTAPAPPYTAAVPRQLLSTLLLLALVPVVGLANASVWAGRTVLDEAAFEATVTRALETPVAEAALAERLSEELLTALVQADDRVRLLIGPLVGAGVTASDDELAAGLQPLVRAGLDHPRVEAARADLIAAVHDALVRGSAARGPVRFEGDQVVLDLRDLFEAVIAALDPRIQGVAGSVLELARTEIVLAEAEGLASARDGTRTLGQLAVIVPLAALALGLLAVVLAYRRRRAVVWAGAAVAIGGAAGLALVALGGRTAGEATSAVDPALVTSTFGALSADLVTQSTALVAAGVILALVAAAGGMLPGRRSERRHGSAEPW